MCDLCSTDEKEREAARSQLRYEAERLRELAAYLESIASGSVKPHAPGMALGPMAAGVIRICAEYL